MSIQIKNLSAVYGPGTPDEMHALKNVNLTIPDGQFIGVAGHTGSGKSTLIQHLNGLIRPTEGEILYNGENIYAEGYSLRDLRTKVGLVFQYPEHQLFEVDVLTDVCFGPKNQGLSPEEAKQRAKEIASKEAELSEGEEESSGSVFAVTFVIVLIWVAIL